MTEVDLRLAPGRASDLAPVAHATLPSALGWDCALLSVLDEVPAERALTVLGHREGAAPHEDWEGRRLKLRAGKDLKGRTRDAEACAFDPRGDLWLCGSHGGPAEGPLDPACAWVGRLRAEDVGAALLGHKARLQLARSPFALHRAVNDALAGHALLPPMPVDRERIAATVARGARADKRWAAHVLPEDVPLDVEGLAFREDGAALVGLRSPVTAVGDPIVVELRDPEALLATPAEPPAGAIVWVLRGGGAPWAPVGVRGLHHEPGELHALVGAEHHPRGEHWRLPLPAHHGGGELHPTLLADFDGEGRLEGLAPVGDAAWLYVADRGDDVACLIRRPG